MRATDNRGKNGLFYLHPPTTTSAIPVPSATPTPSESRSGKNGDCLVKAVWETACEKLDDVGDVGTADHGDLRLSLLQLQRKLQRSDRWRVRSSPQRSEI